MITPLVNEVKFVEVSLMKKQIPVCSIDAFGDVEI